ncbi:MAG: PQQ-binding-like beta-propeller repeat protein [Bryobacteraceae bacterium]
MWQFKTNAQVHATAAIANGLTYIAGCDGILRAIRIADGKTQIRSVLMRSISCTDGNFAYFGTLTTKFSG